MPSTVERLAEATGMADWRTFKKQSLGFMSRRPVVFCQWIRPRISRHAFIEIVPEGERLIVFGVHLSAVLAAWTEQRRTLEFRALMRSVAYHEDRFHVLAGDFNTIAPTDTLEIKTLAAVLATADLVERRPRALARDPDGARCGLRRRVQGAAPGRSWPHAPNQKSPSPARLRVRAEVTCVARDGVRGGQATGCRRSLRSLSQWWRTSTGLIASLTKAGTIDRRSTYLSVDSLHICHQKRPIPSASSYFRERSTCSFFAPFSGDPGTATALARTSASNRMSY